MPDAQILALDIGDKRVGTALSDEAGRMAFPHETFTRAGGCAEAAILRLLEERAIKLVVIGLPLDEKGNRTSQCASVESFRRRLERRAPGVEFVFFDEYCSSAEAEDRLREASSGRKNNRQKGVLDALSASIILQSYIDAGA